MDQAHLALKESRPATNFCGRVMRNSGELYSNPARADTAKAMATGTDMRSMMTSVMKATSPTAYASVPDSGLGFGPEPELGAAPVPCRSSHQFLTT